MALITRKTHLWTLSCCPVDTCIRRFIEPFTKAGIDVGIADKLTAVDEVLPKVANRPLDLALRLRSVGSTGADMKAVVSREVHERHVLHERPTSISKIGIHDRLHLVEQQRARHSIKTPKRLLKPSGEYRHCLSWNKAYPHESGVAEHDYQRVAPAERKPHMSKVDLALFTGVGLKALHFLRLMARSHGSNELTNLSIATGISRSTDLSEQALRAQPGILAETRLDDVSVSSVSTRATRPLPPANGCIATKYRWATPAQPPTSILNAPEQPVGKSAACHLNNLSAVGGVWWLLLVPSKTEMFR